MRVTHQVSQLETFTWTTKNLPTSEWGTGVPADFISVTWSIGRQKTGCGMFSMIYARVISHAGEPFWRARASLHFRWVKFRRKHKTAESLKSFHVDECGWARYFSEVVLLFSYRSILQILFLCMAKEGNEWDTGSTKQQQVIKQENWLTSSDNQQQLERNVISIQRDAALSAAHS